MKLRKLVLSLFACTLALPLSAAHLAKAGKWQGTMQMEMPGMPMKLPAQTFVHCVTKEEAENAENLIPKSGDKRGGCVYTDVKVEGSTMTWKMTCEKSGMTGTGTVTYHGLRRFDADEDGRPRHVRQVRRQIPRRLRRNGEEVATTSSLRLGFAQAFRGRGFFAPANFRNGFVTRSKSTSTERELAEESVLNLSYSNPAFV
jgi:hypothetical protein